MVSTNNLISYGKQNINQADVDAVVEILHSDFLTQGPVVPIFENTVAGYCGSKYGVAVNSATSALHIACLAIGVGKDDVVWTSSITFVASANCALYCGAKVDFIDIDPRTYNLSVQCLSEKLEIAKMTGTLPKVVIPVHLCGQSCDMEKIYELGQKYGFKIIEDASHAIGARYLDKMVGGCTYSDITVFSFHPVKIITTGEGGMALTNDIKLAENMKQLRSHGITKDSSKMNPHPSEELWGYQQMELGYNYRLSDIHAALGLSQMKRLEMFISERRFIADRYNNLLSELPIVTPWQKSYGDSSFHLYVIRLNLEEINRTHCQVFNDLHAAGILVNLHYIPVYRQPYYEKMGFLKGYCPEAERYFSDAITLPVYPGLTEIEQDQVVTAVKLATSV